MALPFPVLSEIFSTEREEAVSVPSEEREITGVLSVSNDEDVSGVTDMEERDSDPDWILKRGHVSVLDDVSLNANSSKEMSAVRLLITNAPFPVTEETVRWTGEEDEEEEDDDVQNSTVHPSDITTEFASGVFMSAD